MTRLPRLAGLLTACFLAVASCGGSTTDDTADSTPAGDAGTGAASSGSSETGSATETDAGSVRLVDVADAAALHRDRPDNLVVLDVRTAEEFDSGHLEGATMLDFHRDDFVEQLAELDPDVPYLLYCRSGNRSGQTRALMTDLGFADVADIDGGIVAWTEAGHPVVTP